MSNNVNIFILILLELSNEPAIVGNAESAYNLNQ